MTMKYMALIYSEPNAGPAYGTPEFDAYLADYQRVTDVYAKDGVMRGGEALQPTTMATTVRVRKGKTQTMDGPFAETKEQLGGYYIFECADLDAAIKYAAMIPDAANGCVEIRPIMNLG
jgi:hypothetical protein